MSKYKDVFGKGAKNESTDDIPFEEWVDVTFMCQFCYEIVKRAKFYPTEYVVIWDCSQGHRSFIEDFAG